MIKYLSINNVINGLQDTALDDFDRADIIQKCFDEGGEIIIPDGDCTIAGTATTILTATKPLSFRCQSPKARLLVSNLTPATTDILTLQPASGEEQYLWEVSRLYLSPNNGDGQGKNAIVIQTVNSNEHLFEPLIERNIIAQFAGYGIYLYNPFNTDGIACAEIRGNEIAGGIKIVRGGDNISVINNQIVGTNIGIEATFVPGANTMLIEANNISNNAGSIYLTGAQNVNMVANQFEATSYSGSVGALVYLESSLGGNITGNSFQPLSTTDCLYLNNTSVYVDIYKNNMLVDSPKYHIKKVSDSISVHTDNKFLTQNGTSTTARVH